MAAQVCAWADEVTAFGGRIGWHFVRRGPHARTVRYIRSLLSQTERKHGWQLAEHVGDPTHDGAGRPPGVNCARATYPNRRLSGGDGPAGSPPDRRTVPHE